MAGLSSFLSDTTTKATTLPAWYDSAQQNIAKSAQSGVNAMPALQNTLAGKAIDTLAGANNPFAQAGQAAQSIATGAANPWNVSATGQVTPNINTAMGGLFQAQNQQLNQLMPNIKAAPQAGGIASGNFGSLRDQTAVGKAMGDAQANLFAQQNQAALNNQQTGVAAAGQVGNLANQSITNQTALGQLQQMDPTMQSATLAKIIGAINNVPSSVTQSAQLSPLSQIGALSGGASTANDILKQLGYSQGLGGIGTAISGGLSGIKNLISGSGGGLNGVDVAGQGKTTVPIDTSNMALGNPVSGTGANGGAGAGQILSTDGNIYRDPSYGTGQVSTPSQNDQSMIDAGFVKNPDTGDWSMPDNNPAPAPIDYNFDNNPAPIDYSSDNWNDGWGEGT